MKNHFHFKYYIVNVIVVSLLSIVISGCESIPPGIAPKGPLVNIVDTSSTPMNQKDAINQMVTALSTSNCLSSGTPNVIIAESTYPEAYKTQLISLPITVYGNLLNMGIIIVNPLKQPDFNIYSIFTLGQNDGKDPVIKWTTFISRPLTKDTAYSYTLTFYLPDIKNK